MARAHRPGQFADGDGSPHDQRNDELAGRTRAPFDDQLTFTRCLLQKEPALLGVLVLAVNVASWAVPPCGTMHETTQ